MIPGVVAATGLVGPPLSMMGRRQYIAGMLPNSLENMSVWLQNPQGVVPGNAMPDMGIDEKDARDMAAYLLLLQ